MTTARRCPRCGGEIADDAPEGLCPACLAGAGLATETVRMDAAGADTGIHTAPWTAPSDPAEIARHFPQLEVLEVLGRGGMGVVYKARQPQLDRLVALKVLPTELAKTPGFAERFSREARALARLNHPNIVAVYDFGQAEGLYYFLMEYVDGSNLRHLIQSKQITPEAALTIVPKICEALQFAHDEGILHRDIKPENILLDRKGRVKIADFGLAKLTGAGPADYSLTGTQQVMGTPRYMAPEQFEHTKTVDQRADIYSLGVVFYEMLTGDLPMGRFAPPSQKVHVDVRLDEVVLKTLEQEPARRYQHASEVKTDVESIAGPGPSGKPKAAADAAPASQADLNEAREQVRAAALALFIVGLINSLTLIPAFLHRGAMARAEFLIWGIFGVTIMIGAGKMKRLVSRDFAVFAGVLAMIPLTSPLFLVGIPVGIWCLRTLKKPAVKEAFRSAVDTRGEQAAKGPAGAPPPHGARMTSARRAQAPDETPSRADARDIPKFSRKSIWAVIWACGVPLAILAWLYPLRPTFAPESAGALWRLIPGWACCVVGASAAVGAPLLGLLAMHEVRHSSGRVVGLPLAFGTAIVLPLLLLALALAYSLGHLFAGMDIGINPEAKSVVTLSVPLITSFFIAVAAWRKVRPPVVASGSEAGAK